MDVQNPSGLSWQALPRLPLASAGILLLAGVLGAVALGVSWNGYDVSGYDAGPLAFDGGGSYGAFSLSFVDEQRAYTSSDFDELDGIGLLRAGGPLLAVGMSLAFVAVVLVVLDLAVPERHLDWVAAGTAGLGFLLLLAALIVLPLGIDRALDDTFGPAADASWSAGLFLAVAAGALALAGTATTLVQKLRTGA